MTSYLPVAISVLACILSLGLGFVIGAYVTCVYFDERIEKGEITESDPWK